MLAVVVTSFGWVDARLMRSFGEDFAAMLYCNVVCKKQLQSQDCVCSSCGERRRGCRIFVDGPDGVVFSDTAMHCEYERLMEHVRL